MVVPNDLYLLFVFSRARLLVNPTSIGDYPGDNYKEYVNNSQSYPLYKDSLSKAIDMADRYLYRKADNQEIEAFSYFFPKDGKYVVPNVYIFALLVGLKYTP